MSFEAIDVNQCQAEKPNGNSFMTLGGAPGLERCQNEPLYIVIERSMKVTDDDFQGAMSLCSDCKNIFLVQMESELENYAIAELIS